MALLVWSWVIVLLMFIVERCAGVPSISFPLNSQVPPVARTGKSFDFVFSSSTFSSSSTLSYSLIDPPKWLSIDSGARRLYGAPTDKDIGPGQVVGVPIELVASDSTGSATMNSTLVVSRDPSPSVKVPLAEQTLQFGTFSSPSSIISPPDRSFTLDLADDTFSNPAGGGLNYYAVMSDNTPLPAWISFDAGRLAFTGTTPPLGSLIQPPQSFGFQLIASDVVGFSAVALPFTLVVGSHEITADQTSITLNATVGKPVSYSGLRGSVKLDGQPPEASQVLTATALKMPGWLSLDKDTWEIHGTPPEGANSTAFLVSLQDSFSDTLNITVLVNMTDPADKIFKSDLPELAVAPGHHFSLELSPFLVNASDIDLSISSNDSLSWVLFDPAKKIVSGDAPTTLNESVIGIAIHAKSETSGESATKVLSLHIKAAENGATSTSTSPAPTGTNSTDGDQEGAPVNLTLVAILVPVFVSLAIILFLLWCYLRRRQKRQIRRLQRGEISGPIPGSFILVPAVDAEGNVHDATKKFDIETAHIETMRGHGGYLEAARLSQPETDIPPTPDHNKMAALKNRIRPGPDEGSRGSRTTRWLTATAIGVLRPSKQMRRPRSRSHAGHSSVYPDVGDTADQNSLSILGNGSGASFIDASEASLPDLPTPSIQQTPEFAYFRPEAPGYERTESRGGPSDNDSSTSLAVPRMDQMTGRPHSRLAYHADGSPASKGARSWAIESSSKAVEVIRRQASLISTTTVDTFAYRKKERNMAGQAGSPDPTSLGSKHGPFPPLPRPQPAKLSMSSGSPQSSTRDYSNLSNFITGSDRLGVQHSGARPEMSDTRTASGATSGQERASVRIVTPTIPWQTVTRNSLGISYNDLMSGASHRPSETASALPAVGAGWDRPSPELRLGSSDVRPPDSSGSRPGAQPNWTLLVESPVARGSEIRESGVTELMSPSRWPQVGKTKEREDSPSGSSLSPVGARANWTGTAGSRHPRPGEATERSGHRQLNSDKSPSTGSRRTGSDATSGGSSREDFIVYI